MPDVVYLIQDMLFSSKLREAAKQIGVTVQGVRDPAAWAAAAREAKLAIVDLRLPAALEALDALAGAPAPGLRTVGFIDHEKTDVMDAARAKGCADVMAKGQFANALPKLLASIAA
jgi:CheY-like chemotaxis protein